jgi:hypothetical protein
MAMDLQFIEKLCQKNTKRHPVTEPVGWEEVRIQENRIVKEGLKNPKLAKIYAALVRGDIDFEEFVTKKRELENI